MSLLAKGGTVSFILEDEENELFVPRTHLMIHDPLGELVRSCDFYFVRGTYKGDHISDSDTEMRELSLSYYGSLDELCEVEVEIPSEGWEFLCNVRKIRYRREGDLADDYQHKYASPQPLFFHETYNAWKVVHPDHCVANHRGIVHP